MLPQINSQLQRIGASEVQTSLDDDFDEDAGTLVRVQIADAYWHLVPNQFLVLLEDIGSGEGAGAVHRAIELAGPVVWHGPSPPDSRDTSA